MPVGVIESPVSRGPEMLAPPDPEPSRPSRSSDGKAGAIEIALPSGARICVDAFVNETALARVLRAIKRAT